MSNEYWQKCARVPEGVAATIENKLIKLIDVELGGKRYRIQAGEAYARDLVILELCGPPTVKRWQLSGKVDGWEIKPEIFETLYAAEARQRDLDCAHELTIAEVEVPK